MAVPVNKSSCPSGPELRNLLEGKDQQSNARDTRSHVNRCTMCQQRIEAMLTAEETSGNPTILVSPGAKQSEWMNEILKHVAAKQVSEHEDGQEDVTEAPAIRFPDKPTESDSIGRLDEFEILHHIASGASGHLYRAFDTRLSRIVAIKVLRAELCRSQAARKRFRQEATAIARVNSENVIRVHEARERTDFPPFLVMEFFEGRSLQQATDNGFRPTHRESVRLLIKVLQGLASAHTFGVIHRDVKPANILVADDSQSVKLVDFGLARLQTENAGLTATGSLAGTPTYMAPEQILNPTSADVAADIYSAGVVLYELLTSEVPFRGSVRMVLQRVIHEEPRSLRSLDDSIPRDLQTISLKAISKLPAQRFRSGEEFRDDLQRWLDGMPVMARPVGTLGRFIRWRRRNPLIADLSLVTAVLALGLTALWLQYTIVVTHARNEVAQGNMHLRSMNDRLRTANRDLESERRTSVQNADNANRQANLAFRVLNRLTFGIQDALSGDPELQQMILRASIVDLEQLSDAVTADSPIALTLATAWIRLAESSLQQGNADDAAACVGSAEQIMSLVKGKLAAAPDAAQCQIWLGLCKGDIARIQGHDDPCLHYSKAVSDCIRIETQYADRVVTLHSHAVALLRTRDANCPVTAEHIDSESPSATLDQCIALLDRCHTLEPSVVDYAFDLASAYLQRANLLRELDTGAAVADSQSAARLMSTIPPDSHLQPNAAQSQLAAMTFASRLNITSGKPVFFKDDVGALRSTIDHLFHRGRISETEAAEMQLTLQTLTPDGNE
jgi:serine/threonine protein kinase